MESVETNHKTSQIEPSSAIREHVQAATVNLLQARLLMARMIREQKACSPRDFLPPRISAINPILNELLRMGALLRHDSDPAKTADASLQVAL